ncbi:MAG TPA: PEP/pyruvate-binding domain-containing protein [Pseudomonadales bacterium]
MNATVCALGDLTDELQASAGGKAGVLARLLRAGCPVPDGFVVLPAAFRGDVLGDEARERVGELLREIGGRNGELRVAVRSSGIGEDSSHASFAGEFDTLLNVSGCDAVIDAIHRVRRSRCSARAAAYSTSMGVEHGVEMAVLVQRMVPATVAGVLFTVDPVTASFRRMVGDCVSGLGDALVSGEVSGQSFALTRPTGRYQGPDALRAHGRRLFRLARRMERLLGTPLDIEWAVDGRRPWILQARPITTLSPGDLASYDVNESRCEDTLWVNTNVGEALPDVMSPLTWSVIRLLDEEFNYLPGYRLWSGNICGRVYSNIGRRISVISALTGWDGQRTLELFDDLFGSVRERVEVPLHPFGRFGLLREVVPRLARFARRTLAASRGLPRFLEQTPAWCSDARAALQRIDSPPELLRYWQQHLHPYLLRAWWSHTAGSSRLVSLLTLDRKLKGMVEEGERGALLSNLRGGGDLASLGPMLGIARVAAGEISREEYCRQYGHRGPYEFELRHPDPVEDEHWLQRQQAAFASGQRMVQELLDAQCAQFEAARERFLTRWPRKRRWLDRRLAAAAAGAQAREAARSEFTRVFRVVRAFALRAGEVTGAGDDVFFLYLDELLELLRGDRSARAQVPARRASYQRFQALPPLPSVIRGRFDPDAWLRDPNRRTDYYDAVAPAVTTSLSGDTLTGVPGAAGTVEGVVRVLARPECGDQLRPGEILVAATTNVGWTPLFPRAAALVTDVGAPLSHAAIVARELGIPAVVGCGNATALLRTGDRVRVDGGRGIVERLERREELG